MGAYINVGNKSVIHPDRVIAMVTGAGAYGPGSVTKLKGYDTWARMPVEADNRSGSKASGHLVIGLEGDGVYKFVGLADGNRSAASGYFRVEDEEVFIVSADEVEELRRAAFPEQYAAFEAKQRAQAEAEAKRALEARLVREAAEARRAVALDEAKAAFATAPAWEVVGDKLYVRSPETADGRSFGARATIRLYNAEGVCRFAEFREPGRLFGRFAGQDIGADIAVGTDQATPVPGAPHVVEARQDRVCLLRKDVGFVQVDGAEFDRAVLDAANRAVAFKVPAAAGLPQLSGSPKQVAWAVSIRAELARRSPTDARLKKAKTAKFWIDNRNSL